MDLNKLSDISIWDVRNVYNKVKNVVMNLTEMEIKVNEATGPEPWGASSTLMMEIAEATHRSQAFSEIMPAIYMRFNDTDPSSWRQVYKALQLLEYLVRNGSERVIDDVRGHITIIKMLRNFHYIDDNGKDQGINVRQRSKELLDLVNDSERVREERKNAKTNRNKYSGYSGGGSMEGFGSSRGGFGSTGGGSGGSRSGFGSSSGGNESSSQRSGSESVANSRSGRSSAKPLKSATTPVREKTLPKPAEPVVADLFSFDDDVDASPAVPALGAALVAPPSAAPATTNALADDFGDDFGDFQGGFSSAPQPAAAPAAPTARAGGGMDLLGGDDLLSGFQPLSASSTAATAGSSQQTFGDFTGMSQVSTLLQPVNSTPAKPSPAVPAVTSPTPSSGSKSGAAKSDAFSDIWGANSDLLSLDSLSLSNTKGKGAADQKPKFSMNQLANQNKFGGI
ncbi:ENTH-domain-containing protein [Linderina pennispora]|uniref:ENTH-domain-containing protein n=1 Tax=Linderina pennispora TaxID=61395 RepID=A0A1Y1W7V2_9FUNG|nr:ENTH-domain-containing protein [Linderina pennispora]ORX69597.1 ENTH-domain-containing protein [Linderina pennispora]